MTATTISYQTVVANLPRMLAMTASAPEVKNAINYYTQYIGKAKTVDDFVGNYRLLSFAMKANGLSDQVNSLALVRKVLLGGVADPKSLANTLSDSRWRKFAQAFDFSGQTTASFSLPAAVDQTTTGYVEQQLESDQGSQNTGVQLALYFRRVAPSVSNSYGLLADRNLTQVVQTIFGLAPGIGAANIDAQAASFAALVPVSDLRDPQKLERLTERFTAMYDLNYGAASGSGSDLVASTGTIASASAATAILGGIVNSNNDILSSLGRQGPNTPALLGNDLLMSLQRQKLGGS